MQCSSPLMDSYVKPLKNIRYKKCNNVDVKNFTKINNITIDNNTLRSNET